MSTDQTTMYCLQCYVKKELKTAMNVTFHLDHSRFNGICPLCQWECFNQFTDEYPKRKEWTLPTDIAEKKK
jgi:hypothetical protein